MPREPDRRPSRVATHIAQPRRTDTPYTGRSPGHAHDRRHDSCAGSNVRKVPTGVTSAPTTSSAAST
ncbi:hypothetical protein CNECB9_1430007 [Cupriavidus necator]|uniref:Uncharacterized protein n=1 Tax=Cupriavidus necator TaxID=106590 RepID=A0A1K0IMC9_CUPNE|nr:hypothetical protein CNECB9_1430007 [Cupriavidus necator]